MAVNIGVEVAVVLGIAVTQTCRGEAVTIVVDHHRTETDLIAPVPVHVGDGIVVIALSVPGAGCVVVPSPALCQLVGVRIHVEGNHLMTGIDAPGQEDARLAAVETRGSEEMLRRAVAVAVAPGCSQVGLTVLQTLQRVVYHLIGHARLTVHIHQVFGSLVHEPVGTAAGGRTVVFRHIADNISRSVGSVDGCTVGSAHDGLRLAVPVPVVGDDVLFVVLEVTHVRTEVEPPQLCAVELEHFHDGVLPVVAFFRITSLNLALVVELHQDLQLTVAVNVGHTGIVGHIGRLQVSVVRRDLQPVLVPYSHLLARFAFTVAEADGCHGVLARCRSCGIGIVRHLQRLLVHLHTVAIEVISHVIVFLGQHTPGAIHAALCLHGHQSAIQTVSHPLAEDAETTE